MSVLASYTDEDAKRTIFRAIRLIALATLVAAPLLWWRAGWQTAALLLVGSAISASGLFEWQRLMAAVMRRMDASAAADRPAKPRPMAPVMIGFFLRMAVALGLLYVSLKFLDGSVYALMAGLGLGVLALLVEAIRLMRLWTV